MATRLSDTHPTAERVQIEILRAMPSWRKFQLLNGMIRAGRELTLAGLRRRFPQATELELRRRLATMWLGPELAAKVYGPEPVPPTLP